MQIKGLLLIAFSSVATTATTFHDGSQVPHARVAVEERHYYEGEPAASSLFHPHHNIQPNSDLPPIMGRDPVGILSRNPKYSTDETFRPVNLNNAPDGTMYIVDFHRGIIQHKTYLTSYLLDQYVEKGLDTIKHYGRITKENKRIRRKN